MALQVLLKNCATFWNIPIFLSSIFFLLCWFSLSLLSLSFYTYSFISWFTFFCLFFLPFLNILCTVPFYKTEIKNVMLKCLFTRDGVSAAPTVNIKITYWVWHWRIFTLLVPIRPEFSGTCSVLWVLKSSVPAIRKILFGEPNILFLIMPTNICVSHFRRKHL